MFSKISILIFLLFFHAEFFVYLCFNSSILFVKNLKLLTLNQGLNIFSSLNINKVYFFILFIFLLFWPYKNYGLGWIVFLSILIFYIVNNIFEKLVNFKLDGIVYLVIPSFVLLLLCSLFINSFLTLFFFVELYGVLYYFFFLTSYSFTNQTILRYKNGLLLLLWNNFLTTFFLSLSCILLLKTSGTTIFTDFNFTVVENYKILLFIIGLFWKLGLPIFHFFKLEVYKYLIKENIFLFSTITILINFFIFYIFFCQNIIFSLVYSYKFISFVLLFCIALVINSLKIFNLLQFFSVSSILTLTTTLSIFIS